jgi:hypothetical protein
MIYFHDRRSAEIFAREVIPAFAGSRAARA